MVVVVVVVVVAVAVAVVVFQAHIVNIWGKTRDCFYRA